MINKQRAGGDHEIQGGKAGEGRGAAGQPQGERCGEKLGERDQILIKYQPIPGNVIYAMLASIKLTFDLSSIAPV